MQLTVSNAPPGNHLHPKQFKLFIHTYTLCNENGTIIPAYVDKDVIVWQHLRCVCPNYALVEGKAVIIARTSVGCLAEQENFPIKEYFLEC